MVVARSSDLRSPAACIKGRRIEATLCPRSLERILPRHLVARPRAAQRIAIRAGVAALRRDENDAVRRARAINRSSGRTLEDLDVVDVGGIEMDHPIGGRRPFLLTTHVPTANASTAGIDLIEVRG